MDKRNYYKKLFIIGALWNLCAGTLFFVLSFIGDIGFVLLDMQVPPSLFFFHVMALWVLVFGIGYLIVGLNIDKNHGIILLGIMAKLIFFLSAVIYVALGHANFLLVALGSVDLVFAILYIEFLIKSKNL